MLSTQQPLPRPPLRGADGDVGKFIPPPAAGIELHTHTLLQALQPHVPVRLLAARSAIDPAARLQLPYPAWTVPNWGRLDAVTISPGVLSTGLRLLRQGRGRALHMHLPNPWADVLALLAPRHVAIIASWHSDIVRQRTELLSQIVHWNARVFRRRGRREFGFARRAKTQVYWRGARVRSCRPQAGRRSKGQ